MKRLFTTAMVVVMAGVMLAGCGKTEAPEQTVTPVSEDGNAGTEVKKEADQTSSALKVACLLNGNLGDKSFFDSANAGMGLVKDELGCETNVIEMGFDNTVWETTLYEVSDQDYDIIIVGTYQMQEILAKVALEYPDQKYIIFDSNVPYEAGDYSNVYSISFKQNEASYLAGVLAAMLAADDTQPLSNGKNAISAVAAMDIPVLNDFIVGYIQGAVDTVPETKVSISYIGDFNDTAKAKDLAKAQFKIGSSVVFNVAAQAGLGMIEAAAEEQKYAIGVDADQAMALAEVKPEQSAVIATSVLKNIDQVLLLSVKRHIEGTLPYGKEEALGMEDNAVGIASNEIFDKTATPEMKEKLKEVQGKIQTGDIKVNSAFTMTEEEITQLKTSVAP